MSAEPLSAPGKAVLSSSRWRGLYRLLFIVAVLILVMVFVFPIIFKPVVEAPTKVQFGSPSSVQISISNHNLTPLTDIEYSCELSMLMLSNGTEVKDANVLIRGIIRKIPGRRATAARCETAYIVTGAIKKAEYKLTLTYRMYPWRQHRTSVFLITAQIDGQGRVAGWKVD